MADPATETPVTPDGLRYVNDADKGISRIRRKDGFTYKLPDGRTVKNRDTLARIKSLAIPPAYENVWICPDENGHIQATGRDARGRKQYRYHARWREHRDGRKYEHVMEFANALPAIRARVQHDMALPGLPRDKVVGTIVHLLETTLIRVGNADYARDNSSYGLTTLQDEHIDVKGGKLSFQFKGKSGKQWELDVNDKRVAKIVKACQDLPGQHLFQYLDEDGEQRSVTSADVNDYLREISDAEISAKDFRTWAGTVLASVALAEFEKFDTQALAKKNIKAAIVSVSNKLGNTPTVCRKCYVHPEVLATYLDGELLLELEHRAEEEYKHLAELRPEEAAVLALMRRRLSEEVAKKKSAPSARKSAKSAGSSKPERFIRKQAA